MSNKRQSFWGYLWKNDNLRSSRWARQHNNIYTRQQKSDVSVLQKAQNSWNSMTKYMMYGDRND